MSKNPILSKMLDRLFAGLTSGPNLNCRPHSSRQRIDWTQFAKLQDLSPVNALRQLLSEKQSTQFQARVSVPKNIVKPSSKRRPRTSVPEENEPIADEQRVQDSTPEDQQKRDLWSAQQTLLTKLRGLAEDARDYAQDTGVHVLHVGFPLLSLPPGVAGSVTGGTKRLLAPIAFIPVSLELRAGLNPVIAIEGLHDGADFLVPNEALFAWLERQTGQSILPEQTSGAEQKPSTLATSDAPDEGGSLDNESRPATTATAALNPWEELQDLTCRVAKALDLKPPQVTPEALVDLTTAPKGEADDPKASIVLAAVLGLFPMNNQGLLRDMQAMCSTPEPLNGPVRRFISTEVVLDDPALIERNNESQQAIALAAYRRHFESERLIAMADPCQARAVRLARDSQGLVIHGPPGTGKSQTITNIIGEHLARGERVLLVCDKRTALDVVARRLEHLGLGSLCALIHDPKHDQRHLYMQIREQLEALSDTRTQDRAEPQLRTLDRQLQRAYDTLAEAWSLVMAPEANRRVSFHQRMGEWIEAALPSLAVVAEATDTAASSNAIPTTRRSRPKATPDPTDLEVVTVDLLDEHLTDIRSAVGRAIKVDLARHPWRPCVGMSLETLLAQPAARIKDYLADIVTVATELDQYQQLEFRDFVVPASLAVSSCRDDSPTSFCQQVAARRNLSGKLRQCLREVDATCRQRWAKASSAEIKRADEQLRNLQIARTDIASAALDPKFCLVLADKSPTNSEMASQIGLLQAYLKTKQVWYGWLHFGVRRDAAALLMSYGLPATGTSAEMLQSFLTGVTSRTLVRAAIEQLGGGHCQTPSAMSVSDDDILLEQCDQLERLLETLLDCEQLGLAPIQDLVRTTVHDGNVERCDLLEESISRGELLEELQSLMVESELFRTEWTREILSRACCGEHVGDDFRNLAGAVGSLGEVLRVENTLNSLPGPLNRIVHQAISKASNEHDAMTEIRRRVLTAEIEQWLRLNANLKSLDGAHLSHLYREVRRLESEKQPQVRELVLDYWTHRQRDRLLASTGTRLNGAGADLRRRLTTRGERALRLRQVVSVGRSIDGGDPLFDLRPVWMASPETVAQIFPREALFDVVIFDEASQCRLEEALPVLTRAKRVVIAGDPKQLPPTRFFESAVINSDTMEAETEQDLFEAHQSDVEDLLTAALSLDIQESYLDVHYRSRNADLVEFSNQQFYSSRLQAIPGHPRNRIRFAPISLYHVAGIYEDRTNRAEAAQVVKIVADLLRRAEPPSIGIACFNLTQRDQILEALAEMAAEDRDFAERLAAARNRVGAGAFEGLFVKNLENVQGDERDHMIISTTYGPDKEGRFFRRFGPLGQAGGGRRLNVLITRARDEVHLVTSIPPELYRNLPPIPEGQQPGGGWLLFAYLAYAERLSDIYRDWRSDDAGAAIANAPRIVQRPSKTPSSFANHLANAIVQNHGIGSDTHWGNDGFCVDIAFHHPHFPEDRTLGLLCDGTRFRNVDDPVTWDVFRTAMLEEQGWQLLRCWTPEFFRDPQGHLDRFVAEAKRIADSDPDPEGIPVEPNA